MKLQKLKDKHKIMFKYILISILAFCTIGSDILIQQKHLNISLTISSVFIFLIIGLEKNKNSLLIITVLNFALFWVNGFNILTSIEALEIYFVWFLYKINKKNIVVEVLIYSITFALPVFFSTCYTVSPNFSIESVFFILMICFNRIFNALIANMLLDYIPFERIIGLTHSGTKTKTISNLLIYATISSIVVPVMIFSFASNSNNQKQISEMAVRDLERASGYVNEKVNLWTEEEKNNLTLKNPVQIYKLVDMLKMYVSTSENSVNFYLVDLNNRVVASNNIVDYMKEGLEWLKDGSLTEINSNIYKWTAPRENGFMIKNNPADYAYLYVATVNDLKIIITTSGAVYTSKVIDIYLNLFKILLPIVLFAGVFVIILKRFILNSISKLIYITSGLPKKLENNETVIFNKSNIFEIDLLIKNFQTMVDNLSNMISNVEDSNKKLQESEQRLFDQANYDSLTGLPNRHYFFRYVDEVMENFHTDEIYADKKGIAFFFMDLDKFKSVNDKYGHFTGDKLLKKVSKRMKNVLKTYDSSCIFIARLGGDEFVIEFVYNNKDEISELANTIIEVINKPIIIESNEFITETSIGICLYPEDGRDIKSIFIKSDLSMYKAKDSGGNKFVFYS